MEVSPVKSAFLLTLCLVSVSFLSGCETEEDRTIARAQACLDNAYGESDANNCIKIVASLDSASSYLIRCSAHFVAQEFTAGKMTSAFKDVDDDAGSKALLGYLVFDETKTKHTAEITSNDCNKSDVLGMMQLAGLTYTATSMVGFAGGGFNFNDPAASMATVIDTLKNSGTNNADVGELAVNLEKTFCSASSSYGSSDLCTKLQSAIDKGGGNAAIGAELLTHL